MRALEYIAVILLTTIVVMGSMIGYQTYTDMKGLVTSYEQQMQAMAYACGIQVVPQGLQKSVQVN